ncbi:hypothetical protein SLS55_002204 [Diplodia seriata]|uniref:Uncharacterized protein n=1 Tax=Diplodia seriata TaxID=420778 RepID=A0ABR3CU68_9PEZI
MPSNSASNADTDQSEAFRYELGTLNREIVLASFDRRDDYARVRFPPRAPNQGLHQAGDSVDPILAAWKNFRLTTTDRDLDAEKQDRLHDGQLYRLNRQARGEVIHHPPPPPVRRSEPALNPILSNPGNADPLALAKALQFKGAYKAAKGRPPMSSPRGNFSQSGLSGRGNHAVRGGGGFSSGGNGRNAPTQTGGLNPHADIHADQRYAPRRKRASVVRGGPSTGQPLPMLGHALPKRPANTMRPPPHTVHGRNGIQHQSNGVHAAPIMDRTNSSMSSASMASSTMGSSASGTIFATGRRPPTAPVGRLATPEEFMAAARKNGLVGSKFAPKPEDKPKDKPAEPKAEPTKGGGLSGSKFAA